MVDGDEASPEKTCIFSVIGYWSMEEEGGGVNTTHLTCNHTCLPPTPSLPPSLVHELRVGSLLGQAQRSLPLLCSCQDGDGGMETVTRGKEGERGVGEEEWKVGVSVHVWIISHRKTRG